VSFGLTERVSRRTTRIGRHQVVFLAAQRWDTVVVAYDEDLANRIREIVQNEPGLTEKRMFGGLAFLINGNMAVSASGQGGLLLRVDPIDTPTLVPAGSRCAGARWTAGCASMRAGWLPSAS
jgi:hypothetical protein